jgi:DNA-binding Xre family transcriptional regulator
MARRLEYRWHLRSLMAARNMFSTTDIAPLLAERGVVLSAAQVYRLVTGTPQRLSLNILVAVCDILDCTPNDLIEPVVVTGRSRATGTTGRSGSTGSDPGGGGEVPAALRSRRPRPAEIRKGS